MIAISRLPKSTLICIKGVKFCSLQFFNMHITLFLSLLVLTSSISCPLSENQRSRIFSGLLSIQPEANKISQDMVYTNNFDNSLAQVPQVCLSISGYEDQNLGYMKIFLNQQSVSQSNFIIRVKSPQNCIWRKLRSHYLVSTKTQIQIGSITSYNPQYDNNGYISLKYQPSLSVTQSLKIRVFISGIDIASQNGAPLWVNHQRILIDSAITLIFSSSLCHIYALTLSIVLFDPSTPGLLFLDGAIEQNSLSTSTQVKVQKSAMQELRINFIGFSSIYGKNSNGLSVSLSFNDQFSIVIDSSDINSIKVNYLVLAFVQCGSCTGYPYFYNENCYPQCPQGTIVSSGRCVPIDCKNGYQLNSFNQCVPICGPNSYYSGKYCSCVAGYNMIGDSCNKCPFGTYFSYIDMKCVDICGPNSQYNSTDGRCYCYTGYYLISNQCSTCLAGTVYDSANQQCLNQSINCGNNQILAFGKCICENYYYKINNICQKCPPYSSYNAGLGYCQCDPGYKMTIDSCVSFCKDNQVLVGSECQCRVGYNKNVFGICASVTCAQNQYLTSDGQCTCQVGYNMNAFGVCVPIAITCSSYQVLIGRTCQCIPGYSRNPDGLCYKIQCLAGQIMDPTYGRCVSACASNTNWDNASQRCIPQCAGGFVYDFNYGSCIPTCQTNYKWNGQQCVCSFNCELVCPPGLQYNQAYQACLPIQSCSNNQIFNGVACVCATGYSNIGGICQISCQPNAQYINGRCTCNQGYTEVNGYCSIATCQPGFKWDPYTQNCISICTNNRIWNGGSCACPVGTYDLNGVCVSNGQICNSNNQYFVDGRCQCITGFYRIGQICSRCPINTQWNPTFNQCVSIPPTVNCANGMVWVGFECQCPPGTTLNIFNRCSRSCGPNQVPAANNQCVCIDGFVKNNFNQCVSYCSNGDCSQNCGRGEEWSEQNCVCKPNHERVSPKMCLPICGRNQIRRGFNCVCKEGFQENRRGQCKPINNDCRNDQILINGKCICREGLIEINGKCSSTPTPSPYPGPSQSCMDPNSVWDQQSGTCKCIGSYSWVYGGCKVKRRCERNQVFNGQDCVCQYGYVRNGNYCQKVNQNYYCPPNSNFNGVNCQCNEGYYPYNNADCISCPSNNYWDGQQCGASIGKCQSGFQWDHRKKKCYYPSFNCKQNQYWDGANCRCNQGFFYLQGRCSTCPPGSVFDGIQCTRGQMDSRCYDPYSYWNGDTCVCIPGYWQLGRTCVTCPQYYQWNGICCSPKRGLSFARTTQNVRSNAVDVKFK